MRRLMICIFGPIISGDKIENEIGRAFSAYGGE